MTIISESTQLLEALRANDIEKVETVISNSDVKRELIKNFVTEHGKDELVKVLPEFKSQGLVTRLQELLDI